MSFAVIGCGMLARSQHIPNLAASRKTVLHTCCDLDDKTLDECRNVSFVLGSRRAARLSVKGWIGDSM